MSKIGQLAGKPKDYTIGGITLTFHPRGLEDLDLLFQLNEPRTQAAAMTTLMKKTLKKADPEATDEEINAVAIKHFEEISTAIMDVNGLTDGVRSKDKPTD